MQRDNFFALAQKLTAKHTDDVNELVEVITETSGGRVELIVSSGQVSPPGFIYEQDEDEWVMVLQGNAILEAKGKLHELGAGDSIFLPKRTKHRVVFTSTKPVCLWLAVFWR